MNRGLTYGLCLRTPVGCEPVSAPNSLLTGKLTGNLPISGVSAANLSEIDRGQGFAIVAARARQAVALDEGASGFGRDAEAFGDLSVGELFGRHD